VASKPKVLHEVPPLQEPKSQEGPIRLSLVQRIALQAAMRAKQEATANLGAVMEELGLDPNGQYAMSPDGVLREVKAPVVSA